jgi:hypothetical protein
VFVFATKIEGQDRCLPSGKGGKDKFGPDIGLHFISDIDTGQSPHRETFHTTKIIDHIAYGE